MTVLEKAIPENKSKGKGVGEYQYIETALTQVMKQKDEALNLVDRQKKPLRDSFVLRLINGNIGNLPSLEDALDHIDLRFERRDFLVLVLYVEDYFALFQDEKDVDDAPKISLAHFILSNVFGELFSGEYTAHMVIAEERPTFLINLNYSEKKEDVPELIRYAQEFIGQNFGLMIQAGVSEPKSSYEGIAEAFAEAVETVEYKVLLERKDFMYYHEMPRSTDNRYRYGYSVEREQNLVFAIQAGNVQDAERIVNELFDEIRGTTDINIAKCFVFDIGSTLIRAIEEISPQWNEENSVFLQQVQELLGYNSIPRMQVQLCELIVQMCTYFGCFSKQESLSNRIHIYVEEHLDDPNLNVAAIGLEFSMVPRYISKLFKDETGEGLLDHINRLRVRKAKQILEDRNLKLEDVATQVGFTTVNSFIRVFKKFENITPGKYREMLK